MYTLLQSMQTGIPLIDAEHQDLVMVINRILEAEQAGEMLGVKYYLTEFKEHLTEHFESEERYLRMVNYPGSEAHAKHHAETLTALNRLIEDLSAGAIEIEGIAAECFNELLGTLLTMDMRFLNWQAEQK